MKTLLGVAGLLSWVGMGLVVSGPGAAWAQTAGAPAAAAPAPSVERASSDDAPDDPGPLATGLSPEITHAHVRAVAKKVADWELAQKQPIFNQQWTFAALYDGFLAASKVTGDAKYRDAMVKMSE